MSDDSDVQVRFGAQVEGVVAGVNEVKEQIESLAGQASGLVSTFQGVGTALAELFAVEKIDEYAEHMSGLGEQAIRTSEMLGMSVEKVQELNFASEMVGGGADGAAQSLTRLERNMAEAQSGTGKAYEAFTNLGISLDDLKTKSPDQILGMIADSFAGAADGANKTAYAMDLGGRSAAQLIPLLDQGSEGLERMGMIGEQTGSILSTETAEAFEKTHQGLSVMNASMEGSSIAIFSQLKPAIDAIVQGLTDLAQWFNQAASSGGSMREILLGIQVAFDGLVMGIESGVVAIKTAIEGVGLAFYDLKVMADMVVAAIKDLFVGLGNAIEDALTGHWGRIESDYKGAVDQMKSDWAAGMKEMSKAADEFADDTINSWAKLQQRANEMWAAITGTTASTTAKKGTAQLPPAPTNGGASAGGDNTDEQIAEDKIKTEEELAKIGLATQRDLMEQEVAAKLISKQQEYAALEDYLNLEYQVESEALDEKLNLYASDTREYQQTLNQKQLLDAQYQQQLARLAAQGAQAQEESAKKTAAQYASVANIITRDFEGALQGVLQGTQSWGQAMGKIFSDLASSAVEAIAKIVAEWLIFEVVTEGQGTWGDFMALEKTGGGGVSSLLPSFDVGSWSVPNDMVASIHQGEMIIPAQQAAAIRSGSSSVGAGSSGSGGNFTININAIDQQSGANFLKNNASVIAATLSSQMRNFNSSLRN